MVRRLLLLINACSLVFSVVCVYSFLGVKSFDIVVVCRVV